MKLVTDTSARPKKAEREFALSSHNFDRIRNRIYAHAGISLADHKVDLVYNRLVRRIRALQLSGFPQYLDYIEQSEGELSHFINAMTTNLTSFYREAHHFEYISTTYLAQLEQAGQRKLRVWSAACSVGEEPYSIAISLLESGIDLSDWQVEIIATDIDTNVLTTAKAAVYPLQRIKGLSLARKRLGFLRGTGVNADQVMIKPQLRNWLTFSHCNLMEQWPVTEQVDIIFCRNVMIYFDKDTQNKLLARMELLLKPGGLLCIGHSESPARPMDNFKLLGRTMYQKLT
ncbi:MAG: methyltransferase domain-containing protein [Gammaproteobacteria bacterium]|nr:methyltransferase domain-containing protein [Gammaproteobacteria bacterium]